ncbi:MAG: hypothetical protein BGN88_01100 [Clostridiales bacterium 43-6]|nr:MAG: hypothetical protein BGN88_01100 [Clostridiales bacterium 43-6]
MNDLFVVPNQAISHQTLIRIQSVYGTLKTAERKAADFILSDPEMIAAKSISEVASVAGCSEATLVRLARRMSYSGYPELRSAVVKKTSEASVLYQGIDKNDSQLNIITKVFSTSVQAIHDTLNILDIQKYEAAVEILKSAGKIMFLGSGDASAVAMSGFYKFLRLGLDTVCQNEYDLQLVTASGLRPGDVVIAISHSGKTKTIIDVIKCAKEAGAAIIAITNHPGSPLSKNSDIQLVTAAFNHNSMGEVMTKRIPELCIIESLYISLSLFDENKTEHSLETSSRVLTANKI